MTLGRSIYLTAPEQRRVERIDQLAARGARGVAGLLAGMSDSSWTVRRACVAALAALGDPSVAPLCTWLRDQRTDEHSIAAAVDALAAASGGSTTSAVIALLADPSSAVAADAARILGRRGAIEAVPTLRGATAHLDDNVAIAAIEALGAIGGAGATDVLLAILDGRNSFRTLAARHVLAKSVDPRAVGMPGPDEPHAPGAIDPQAQSAARAADLPPRPRRITSSTRGPSLSLSPSMFAMFSHVIEEVCGVCYGPADVAILTSKLETRMLELGYESLQDYYARLRHDDLEGIELHALVETVLVHETYFFRELAPLAQLVNSHLAGVVRARGAARVWSAACSTGEEAFTLAMLLDDGGLLDRTSIVASDVSASAIAVAKTGHHGARALRDGHPPGLVRRYLRTRPNGGLAVVPRIRDAVQFQTLNLLDEDAVQGLGLFDAIVCRNVLIYFRDDRIAGVVDRLGRSLRPTGMIVVGVSESLLRFGTGLVCEERGSSFFYRSAR